MLSIDGNNVAGAEVIRMGKRIRAVAQASDGNVLLLTDGDNGEFLAPHPIRVVGSRLDKHPLALGVLRMRASCGAWPPRCNIGCISVPCHADGLRFQRITSARDDK